MTMSFWQGIRAARRPIAGLALFVMAGMAAAQVPQVVNYQGRLVDSGTQTPVEGTVNVVFSMWDAASNGNMLWSETWSSVPVTKGVFSVLLGSNGTAIPASVVSGGTVYLQLEIDNEVMTPRQQLGSVPFAMQDDPWNELNTGVALNGTTIEITDGGGTVSVDLSSLQDGTGTDSQTLSLAGSTLSISGGNSVDLSGVGGGGSATYGHSYLLASAINQTIVGGADIAFPNNGPLSGVSHTAGTTTIIVPSTGTYRIDYQLSFVSGIGAAIALAVNGTVDSSTNIPLLESAGHISASALLVLFAGDVLTVRNNSATPFSVDTAPAVGAGIVIEKID